VLLVGWCHEGCLDASLHFAGAPTPALCPCIPCCVVAQASSWQPRCWKTCSCFLKKGFWSTMERAACSCCSACSQRDTHTHARCESARCEWGQHGPQSSGTSSGLSGWHGAWGVVGMQCVAPVRAYSAECVAAGPLGSHKVVCVAHTQHRPKILTPQTSRLPPAHTGASHNGRLSAAYVLTHPCIRPCLPSCLPSRPTSSKTRPSFHIR
jgi:hypothetical protein